MSDIVQQLRGGPRVDRIADTIGECGGCGGRDFPKQHNCQACTDKVDDDVDDLMVRSAEEIERLRAQVSLQTTQILEQQNQAMARIKEKLETAHQRAAERDELFSLRAENARLREALTEIADRHIGDCPAALAHLSDADWAQVCHGNLRKIARAALITTEQEP